MIRSTLLTVGLFAHTCQVPETVEGAVEFSTGGDGTFDGTYRAVSAHTTPAVVLDQKERALILTDEGKIDFSYGNLEFNLAGCDIQFNHWACVPRRGNR